MNTNRSRAEFYDILTIISDVSPPGDPAARPGVEDAAAGCQTHGVDEIGEGDRRGQLQQRDVIIKRYAVVARVHGDLGHRRRHLVRVHVLLILTSEINHQTRCAGTEERKQSSCYFIRKMSSISVHSSKYC